MSLMYRVLCTAPAILAAIGCAQGAAGDIDGSAPDVDGGSTADAASCAELCDDDDDGVPDGSDDCPDTPPGAEVNDVGCADAQVDPTLQPDFPPYGLTWTPAGDLGRAGGLTWTYVGIQRDDLFHIYWVICDDPATPCGLSLDGPIDVAAENWQFSAADSDLAGGRVVFTNTTHIVLADTSTPTLSGRLTVTAVDATISAIPFAALATLGVTGRAGQYGAEILGNGFRIAVVAEVLNTATATWTPYLDYYDAAPTPKAGGSASTSFGGSFYDE